jgi:hypothetical protein
MNRNIEQTISKHIAKGGDYHESVQLYSEHWKHLEHVYNTLKDLEAELYANEDEAKLFKLIYNMKNNSRILKYPTVANVINIYENINDPACARFLLDTIKESALPF